MATLIISVPSLSSAQARGAAPAAGAQAPAPAQGAGPAGGPQAPGQGRGGRGGRGALYTPAPGAKDLKSVMFNWGWHMGMLRSDQEYDLIMTLAYSGKGSMQVGGQPCNVSLYRSDINYKMSGERIRLTGTRPNGQSCSTIEVLSGGYTWNEDIMGAELVPGKGKATPMPATVEDRMIRLWSGPQGAFKAAFAGTSPDAPPMTPRPQQLAADVMTIAKTTVAWTGNKPVLTYPIPGVPNATATATLDNKFMAESVVVKNGKDTYEFTYSDYKDWNNPLNPVEAYYAGRMIEKKNGTVVRDITTTVTETGQMYVTIPVPASVKAAIKPTHQPPNWTLPTQPATGAGGPGGPGGPGAAPAAAAQTAAVTPRRADGKPDLTGNWGGSFNPITGGGNRRCGPTQKECKVPNDNFVVDYEWISPSRFGVLGHPIYKPEFWDKIQELDQWTNKYDPVMTCKPLGLPRHGTPRRIIQSDSDVIFFYGANADYGGGNQEYRDIPTDGRQRSARSENLATFYGNSIGHWEGDTLVIDSTSFDDTTWLGRGGLIHSGSMHIVEKLTRVGNEIRYDMTIEDPEMFVEPWVMPTRVLRAGAAAVQVQPERANCEVYEEGNVSNQLRH
ncbi:MAG TPA: hypothetical protein VFX19_12475 [Dehalococcoidia bacterium]|nr:hypothetical protein [Dehalococcoidia bacterium]